MPQVAKLRYPWKPRLGNASLTGMFGSRRSSRVNFRAEAGSNLPGDGVRSGLDRIRCQVGVASGRLYLSVSEKLSDHRQTLAGGDGRRGESMPEVVDADVLEARAGSNTLPKGPQVRDAPRRTRWQRRHASQSILGAGKTRRGAGRGWILGGSRISPWCARHACSGCFRSLPCGRV